MPGKEREEKGSLFDRFKRKISERDTTDSAKKERAENANNVSQEDRQLDAREILARRILHSQKYGLPISDRMAKDYKNSSPKDSQQQPDKSEPSSPKRPRKK